MPGTCFEQGAAAAVAGGKEDQVVADDRRGNDGRGFFDVVRPQQFAVVGSHAHRAAAGRLHIDARAADVGNDDRRVAGAAIVRPRGRPQGLARLLVEATIVFFSPPGVQTSLSPSISTDSL